MTRIRGLGGGNYGEPITLTCVPDSTFITEITALIAAGTDVVGKYVAGATSANFTVTSPAADAQPWGEIIAYENDADNTYILTCEFWQYADYEAGYHSATKVRHLAYGDGTIALGQEVRIHGSTYMYVDGVNSGGRGFVFGIDEQESGYVDVLF